MMITANQNLHRKQDFRRWQWGHGPEQPGGYYQDYLMERLTATVLDDGDFLLIMYDAIGSGEIDETHTQGLDDYLMQDQALVNACAEWKAKQLAEMEIQERGAIT